jgi:hypothetical protein
MNDSEDGAGRNRRETPASVIQGRAARQLVAPVQEKLGLWQGEAVKLEMMVQRVRTAGRSDPSLAEAARTLLGVVRMQAQLFEAGVATAEPVVRGHSRVADTQKVLGLLAARIETILVQLGEPDDKAR